MPKNIRTFRDGFIEIENTLQNVRKKNIDLAKNKPPSMINLLVLMHKQVNILKNQFDSIHHTFSLMYPEFQFNSENEICGPHVLDKNYQEKNMGYQIYVVNHYITQFNEFYTRSLEEFPYNFENLLVLYSLIKSHYKKCFCMFQLVILDQPVHRQDIKIKAFVREIKEIIEELSTLIKQKEEQDEKERSSV